MKESNPIKQRIEMLVEKWEAVAANPEVSIVRIHAKENEKNMVGTFCNYMLAMDTGKNDIAIIFNSIFHEGSRYSTALLKELEELINTWNKASKDNVDVKVEHIAWQPDYSLVKSDNAAYQFIENINRFAIFLNLPDGVFLVPILRVSFNQTQAINNWLSLTIKAGIHSTVKIIIDDTVSNPSFISLAEKHPGKVATLLPELDMDNAMKQLSAMGNPNDPAVQYRKAFMLLVQAIEKRREKDAEKQAGCCLEIAMKNLLKNPYWIGQVIAVYTALANDQTGYRNYKKAINYSTLAVKAAEKSKDLIQDEFVYRKFMAQALMMRASMYVVDKDWQKAIDDYELAAGHYTNTNDVILAMEAYRMIGFSNQKYGNTDAACAAFVKAINASKKIPAQTIKFTTFPAVLEAILEINNSKYISQQEVETVARSVYGDNWLTEIKNWKNSKYEEAPGPSQVMAS